MYFRMLKRDLQDKIGLNITLFVFMILASVFMIISSILFFTRLSGISETYIKCNTSDLIFSSEHSISDPEGQINRMVTWLEDVPEVDNIVHSTRVITTGTHVDFDLTSDDASEELKTCSLILTDMPQINNVPLNMNDEHFSVSDGYVAIPQNLQINSHTSVGDKIRLTTQMGNIYEFTISDVFKDPASQGQAKLIFSDSDYAVIDSESPLKCDILEVYTKNIDGDYENRILDIGTKFMNTFQDEGATRYAAKVLFSSNDGIISLIVSIVMVIIGFFMIGMIFVTIHFSLKSVIKSEEKEIGMMKAIGLYSFSYRALFAVKYIAFAVVGGIFGVPLAFPLSNLLINTFVTHTVLPGSVQRIMLALLSVCVCVVIIVTFTFLSMRRMNRISVMDAIHGENRGERFSRLTGLFLHRSKLISIPLFLAVSDIFSRIKRYVFLILAYVAGISIILIVLQLKDAIVSDNYAQKYWMKGALDFNLEVDDAYFTQLYNKAGSIEGAYQLINENFKKNGIPAEAVYFRFTTVSLSHDDYEAAAYMKFGTPDRKEVMYVEGGNPPELYNEIAMSYYNAKQAGIEIGDIVSITYDKFNEDNISSREVTEDFVVTAMYDGFGAAMQQIIMGQQFDGAVGEQCDFFKFEMNCDDSEYDMYYQKMDDMYADNEVRFMHKKDAMPYFMDGFDVMFNLMLKVVSVVVAIVLTLLTVLYQNIFIEEEAADIAVLKSMGFHKHSIKLWQYFRILILLLASIVTAHLFVATIANYIVSRIVKVILKVVDFNICIQPFANYVIIPVCVIVLVTVVLMPVLKAINSIQIWRMRSE